MRATDDRDAKAWIQRILATGLAIVLALQPVARAGSPNPSRGSGATGACCCSNGSVRSCCELPAPHRESKLPTLRHESCGCALRAPIAPLAVTGTAEPREVKSSGAAWAQCWIAEGACASAATPILPIAFGPDPPESADVTRAPAPGRRESSNTVFCARDIHALLATFGTLLR